MRAPIVEPSAEDPVARIGSGAIGGPMGTFAGRSRRWWNPLRVLLLLASLGYLIGLVLDSSCRSTGWRSPENYEHLCYTDIAPLYGLRGFADGLAPYLQTAAGQTPLEYPVLTGAFMWAASIVTRALSGIGGDPNPTRTFFDVNVIGLLVALLVTVGATALTVRRRPWDAAMVALAPTMILAATINWDLLPMAFVAVALLLWARQRPLAAGVLLGLAIAAKFYPLVLLGGFLLLALRTARWPAFARLLGGAALGWAAVNVPVMLANFDGWARFYRFSSERGQDFGSIWFAAEQLGLPAVPADRLNIVATGLFGALCVAIAVLVLRIERRPRLASVLFLILAAFAVTNKVYSPQYVLWLVPLAALARPRWRDFLLWQAGEVVYFVAIWWFLVGYGTTENKGLPAQWYAAAVLVHVVATAGLAAVIIRDMLRPERDPVRTDGFAEHADDPAGGVFDGAPDAFTLGRVSR